MPEVLERETQAPSAGPKSGAKLTPSKLTPLMQQYWDVKSAHPDKLILFRMGDFFEMFHRDAEVAAPVLGIALTSRNKKAQDETPMCGVPHHSVGNVINKLLAAGFKIAICDQLEDPKFAKGLVKRGVTRVLSPGMVFDPETLDASTAHYLASWDETGSLAFFDVTTKEGFFFRDLTESRRLEFLESLRAVEWIVSGELATDAALKTRADSQSVALTRCDDLTWRAADGTPLASTADLGLEPTMLEFLETAPIAVKRLLTYAVGQFAKADAEAWVQSLPKFEERRAEGRMILTPATLRHLEIFETYKGDRNGSLIGAIDRTRTSAGARLLRSWLQFPLVDRAAIELRHERVQRWLAIDSARREVRQALGGVGDLQRRLGKISQPSRGPRDVLSLAQSIEAGLASVQQAAKVDKSLDLKQFNFVSDVQSVADEVRRVLIDEPPVSMRQGGAIRVGANPQLDELITLSTDSGKLILELEAREREATGISSLKIRYNNVFGYSIEITNTHKDRVPKDRYDRKQTLANAERYTTEELAQLEAKVLSAQERRLKLEEQEFQALVQFVLQRSPALLAFAQVVAELDVVSALAHIAAEHRYVRPKFHEPIKFELKGSRHPVVEQALAKPFVANDIIMDEKSCLLLTGPNMAGKSTLMRQVAISVVMAQMGSFVPAAEAKLPLFERVSTRIGASDFLAEGLSTFMVEMKETAELLESATERTLIILDEIGRGTSTFDGLSLAQAVLEHLLTHKPCLTLFATHYHELTSLADRYPRLKNGHMAIFEKGGAITFLHRLTSGSAGQSYGIHVARLAGMPAAITKRAEEILKDVEGSLGGGAGRSAMAQSPQQSPQLMLAALEPLEAAVVAPGSKWSALEEQVLMQLRQTDINETTPMQAMMKLSEWVKDLGAR